MFFSLAFIWSISKMIIARSQSCMGQTHDATTNAPAGISIFEEVFNIQDNELLSTLRAEVINNKCNFGDTSLSSSIFSFAPGYVNLHCGSYGATPKYVVQYKDHIRNVLYSRPHVWDDVNSTHIMDVLRQDIAQYLGIPNHNDLVFTINASHCLMAVIRSLMDHFLSQFLGISNDSNQSSRSHSDLSEYSIIYFNTGHGAYISPLKHYQKLWNISLIEVEFTAEILRDYKSIIEKINDTLISHGLLPNNNRPNSGDSENADNSKENKVIFAVFSHITSIPSLILPLHDIVSLLHDYNIMTVVDGAHAMGQIYDLNIAASDCDIYISNAYKWFYSPWNTAVIYVKEQYQDIIKPPAIGYGEGASFQKLFHHPGTVDESAYLSLMGSLEFRRLIGGDRNILEYIHSLAIEAQRYLSELWNTTVFSSDSSHFVGMINVELPKIDRLVMSKEVIDRVFYALLKNDDIAIKLFEWNGRFYVRVSCQIYNDMSQIERVGALILQYLNAEVVDVVVNHDNVTAKSEL